MTKFGFTCPERGGTDVYRDWNVGNLLRCLCIVVFMPIFVAVAYIVGDAPDLSPAFKWTRRCRKCGASFDRASDERRLVPSERADCDRCGYDLTGNISGTCPECGAPILRPSKR